MFVHNSVSNDGRVLKEAASLAAHGWRVVIIGLALEEEDLPTEESVSGFTIRRVIPHFMTGKSGSQVKLLRLIVALPRIVLQIRRTNACAYHAHDFVGLLVMALAGIWRRPLIYDSHELFFDRFPSDYKLRQLLKLLRPLEKKLAKRATAVITVGNAVADRIAQTLSVSHLLIVRNAVDLKSLDAPVPIPRQDGQQIIAHTGYLTRGRHLPELIAALRGLPENITLALIGDGPLREPLMAKAQELGVAHRLLMVYPVTPTNIPSTLAQADAAAILITSEQLNYHLSLPNKFFEAVAAGVPIIASPIPEIAALMQEHDLGVFCDATNPSAIADAVNQLLQPEHYDRYRANVAKVRSLLSWEAEAAKLVGLYEKILRTNNAGK